MNGWKPMPLPGTPACRSSTLPPRRSSRTPPGGSCWSSPTTGIVLQQEELDDYQFTDPAAVAGYLPPFIVPRIPAALAARASGAAAYLPAAL